MIPAFLLTLAAIFLLVILAWGLLVVVRLPLNWLSSRYCIAAWSGPLPPPDPLWRIA